MELEELKKSWNALDEHLKDKEFIKEEELEKLIRHADKGIHAIASLNIKLILISLPILILFLAEVLLHNRLNPIYIIIIFAWIPALCWDIVTTRFLQRTQIDEMPLVEVISRVNRIHRWTIRERLIAIAFLLVLAVLSFIYWQVWQYGIGMIAFFYPVMGRRTRIDFMDLPQEVLKSHPRNKEEFKRIERINVKGDNGCAYPTTVSTLFPFTFLCTCT